MKSGIDNDFAEGFCFATTGCATTEESLTQIPQIGKDFCAMKSGIDNDFAECCCFATTGCATTEESLTRIPQIMT